MTVRIARCNRCGEPIPDVIYDTDAGIPNERCRFCRAADAAEANRTPEDSPRRRGCPDCGSEEGFTLHGTDCAHGRYDPAMDRAIIDIDNSCGTDWDSAEAECDDCGYRVGWDT